MHIETRVSHDKVRHDQENEIKVVVTLTAPKIEWEAKRPPLCIVPVIDTSSSMQGDKIERAKQSCLKLLDHVKPGDYCGLVVFSDEAKLISAPIEMTQASKDKLKTQIGEITAYGNTNFSGGMMLGFDQVNKADLPAGVLTRVIILTDGQANRGESNHEGIMKVLDANIGKATLSAFGYGSDANQELLADVARRGKGNYAFIKHADDALSAFAKELGGLLSTYAQNIVLDLAPHNGHKITEVISDVDVEEDGAKIKVKLSDILSEEVRHIVLKMKLSAQSQALPRALTIVDAKVDYDVLENGKKVHHQDEIKAKLKFVKDGEQDTTVEPGLDKIIGVAEMVKAQIAAEKSANVGNYDGAQAILRSMAGSLQQRGLVGLADNMGKTSEKFASRTMYVGSAGYRSSTKGLRSRGMAMSGADPTAFAEASLDLAGVSSLNNAAQKSVMGSFEMNENNDAKVDPIAAQQAADQAILDKLVAPFVAPAVAPMPAKSSVAKSRSKRW